MSNPINSNELFCHLSSASIASIIRTAEGSVCYAGPGIQQEPAKAMSDVANRIGPELLTVSLDFDERVMRMGYGDIAAVQLLRDAGIVINNSHGLRNALIIVDGEGYTFTPTPLYLEAETTHDSARNALRLSHEQVSEALARLSPAAKAIAIAQTDDKEEKARIANLPVEVGAILVDDIQFQQVDNKLKEAPPVKFDLARQVRVFEPYLQYVELSLTGAAIQRHRISIPPCIQKLGSSEDLEGRLRTTFDLINKDDKLSSKSLDASLRSIRDDLTKSLGKQGRVISKAQKPLLMKRLGELRVKLKAHQDTVADELQQHLDGSRKQIIDYYLPLAIQNPSDAIHGQLLVATEPTENDVRRWLNAQLDSVFPRSETLIQDMRLEERFKDVTYETLNHKEFLQSVKKAFSGTGIDWDKAYEEFLAAGEKDSDAHEE